jgi:hypothetical protein
MGQAMVIEALPSIGRRCEEAFPEKQSGRQNRKGDALRIALSLFRTA